MTSKLLPCPFCGGEAKTDNGFAPLESIYYVWCSSQQCFLSDGVDLGLTADAWNKRAAKESQNQEPVAAQIRYRPVAKGLPGYGKDFGPWQDISLSSINPERSGYVDSVGYEVETRLLYAAPLSPDHSGGGAGMVLPERKPYPGIGTYPDADEYTAACNEVSIWNACLDKVKELNQ